MSKKTTDWSINTDVYDILDSIKKVQSRYIEDEDETTLALGIYGFIAESKLKVVVAVPL